MNGGNRTLTTTFMCDREGDCKFGFLLLVEVGLAAMGRFLSLKSAQMELRDD
jgi:hypothetical protein